jgi:hypothetical protein
MTERGLIEALVEAVRAGAWEQARELALRLIAAGLGTNTGTKMFLSRA